MPRFIDTDPTPDEYLYNKVLVKLTAEQAAIPASQMTVRVAASNGTEDTFPVTEWLGTGLPPHVAGYQQGFFTRYQDPTENRAQLDKLAADFPSLVTAVNLPNLTGGYQRKSSAIMYGDERHRHRLRRPRRRRAARHHGRDHGRRAGRAHPVHRHRGAEHPRDRRRRPVRLDRLHPDAQGPDRRRRWHRSTRAPARSSSTSTFATAGTYTFEVSGYQGDLGDFTFKLQPVTGTAATAQAGAVVLTVQGLGPPRRRPGHRRVQDRAPPARR